MMTIVREWHSHRELTEIESRAAEMYREVGYVPDGWATNHPEDFARHQASGLLWVSVLDGRPVGFAVADIYRDALHLEELDVDPDFGRRGIGTGLVSAVIADARRRRLRSITLRTFTTTPWSAGLYGKCGFRVLDDEVAPYYLGPLLDNESKMGLPMADRCTMAMDLQARPAA